MATPPLPSDLAVAQQVVKECGHVECSENATHMTSASACAPCLAQALAKGRGEQREQDAMLVEDQGLCLVNGLIQTNDRLHKPGCCERSRIAAAIRAPDAAHG